MVSFQEPPQTVDFQTLGSFPTEDPQVFSLDQKYPPTFHNGTRKAVGLLFFRRLPTVGFPLKATQKEGLPSKKTSALGLFLQLFPMVSPTSSLSNTKPGPRILHSPCNSAGGRAQFAQHPRPRQNQHEAIGCFQTPRKRAHRFDMFGFCSAFGPLQDVK